MKKTSIRNIILAVTLLMVSPCMKTHAQSSRVIMDQILLQWGKQCSNMAITDNYGQIAFFYPYRWGTGNLRIKPLYETLSELTNNNQSIEDVQLTEQGRWIVVYNRNKYKTNFEELPQDLIDAFEILQKNNKRITTLTFNETGDWVIIYDNDEDQYIYSDDQTHTYEKPTWGQGYLTSNSMASIVSDAVEEYGKLVAAYIYEGISIMIICEKGFVPIGDNVENNTTLLNYIVKCAKDWGGLKYVKRVKVTKQRWIISNGSATTWYAL